jgi:catechol 2,3-dioxygenase-like lactoylglutathione lyase family enzyme
MVPLSPAKVQVKEIGQVALVVKDVQLVSENYWTILGIGPWTFRAWEPPLIHDRRYKGRPAWARERLAVTTVGKVGFELCQYIDGDSIYQDFLAEHGEGLQHLNFQVDDQDATAEILAKQGFPSIRSGRQGPDGRTGNYIYIEPLHATWELVVRRRGPQTAEPVRQLEAAPASPAKVPVKAFGQVGLVVKDAQSVAENYWNILGIGPWQIYSWEEPLVHDHLYHGKPAWVRAKVAQAQVGAVQLELYQPVAGESIYGDFLKERGEGLHHISFFVDNVDETAAELVKEGFPSLESGRFGDNGAYNCLDIKPLRTLWQIVKRPTNMGVVPFPYPKESA